MTFRDPEAARRACVDPTPIIDGRRANCNLASLGRPPRLPLPNIPGWSCFSVLSVPFFLHYLLRPFHITLVFCLLGPASPYVGSVQAPRGSLFGSHPYQQTPAYSYQQGVMYPYG